MASSTAFTTICGSMPFSRLRASITLYSSLAIKCLPPYFHLVFAAFESELGNQVRLLDVGQLNFNFGSLLHCLVLLRLFPAGQFHTKPVIVKRLQPPFKMPVSVYRVPGHQLHQTAGETLVVCRL